MTRELLAIVVSLLFLGQLRAAYFSMSDIQLNIPKDKTQYPSINHALLTLYALKENESHGGNRGEYLRYTINFIGDRLLQVYPTTGDIMFTQKFFRKNITSVSVEATVEDSVGVNDTTTVKVNILQNNSHDCNLMTEDLCFWHSASYNIYENTKPTIIGSLGSPYLVEICPKHKIRYSLLKGEKQFSLVTPTKNNKSWSLRTTQLLDRDVARLMAPFDRKSVESGEKRKVYVQCTVESEKGKIKETSRDIVVKIFDENDNVPKLQKQADVLNVHFSSKSVQKDTYVEHKDLLFIDKDSPPVNQYDIKIHGDYLDILNPNCITLEDDREGESQTATHCKLYFTKDTKISESPYSVTLELNDTTLRKGFGNSSIKVPINIYFSDQDEPPQAYVKSNPLDKFHPSLYPVEEIKIFRTAAPFARITQPLKNNPQQTFTIYNDTSTGAFNVTFHEGIVYVENVTLLRESSHEIQVIIQRSDKNVMEMDTIFIKIISEPTHTCSQFGPHQDRWPYCSKFKTKKSCNKACGLSTGGFPGVKKRTSSNEIERCMWRGEANPGNITTPLYATCTPDISTCPNGVCDALESLNELICPQDCTENIIFPMQRNIKTKKGFDVGEGVCYCNPSCTCEHRDTKKLTNKTSTTLITTSTLPPELDTTKHYSNSTLVQPNVSRHISTELAKCGTTCILGVAGSAVFLIIIVGGIMFCWKLERVHKAVREKFLNQTPELQVPLSDYIDRSAPPDTLQFNFDATTAFSSQLNRIEPDPKWEFPRTQLIIEQTLGEGEFGRVLKARAFDILGQPGYTTVAVKTLKNDAGERELSDLLSEYQLLKEVSHPNVIRLLGASTSPGGPLYLIIEYAEHGSLRNYLRKSRHIETEVNAPPVITKTSFQFNDEYDEPKVCSITPKDILSFSWQIANGMTYLSDIKLVHRDLAARNVLIADRKICKISDFGLTRDVYEDDAYFKRSKGRVPVKWMAPESLTDQIYTNKSDVWSYGILLWELVTLGASPYPGVMVQSIFHLLKTGYRMERPENCSVALYKVMRSCWHVEPEKRPTFSSLSHKFEQMLTDQVQYLDLTGNAVNNRGYFCDNLDDTEDDDEKAERKGEAVNYLNQTQDYEKSGSVTKINIPNEENAKLISPVSDSNSNNVGYETPIKVQNNVEVKTPGNEFPQYGYTDMSACSVTK